MEHSVGIFELQKITKQRNIFASLSFLIGIIALVQSIIILTGEKSVILVPSFQSGDVSLSNKNPSEAYLEGITRDVINTMLDITPENVNYASEQILKITDPSFYGSLKQQLNQRAEDVVARKITINFYPQSMNISRDKNTVIVSGKLMTFLGKEMVMDEEKSYSITYQYNNFKLLIVDFHEQNNKDKKPNE